MTNQHGEVTITHSCASKMGDPSWYRVRVDEDGRDFKYLKIDADSYSYDDMLDVEAFIPQLPPFPAG